MFLRLCAKLNFSKRNRHGRLEKHDEQLNLSPSTKARDHVVANHDVEVSSTQEAESTSQRANLWEVAGEKLNENDRKALGLERPLPITDALESVLKSTEEKYREYKKGGLKIRKRDGGHINVRDSAKSIILHALQAQDLVTRLVSFDPTGHASSAWSVVSIGLSIIKNDIERRDEIFHAAEYLAGILSYYAIVDNHYRERKAESDEGLEDALVEVYTAVLQYTVEVKKAENESKAARTLKSITALVQKPFKELKEAVEKKEQAVRKWADLTEALDRREQAEGMLDVIDKAIEELKIIQSHTRSLQDREILDWLSTASFSDPHNNTQGHRASNTGNWFLNLPEYKEWKITPGKICWLYGAVIQDIEEFCSNDETQKVYNMIRSILRQFMPRALPASIIKLWEEHCNRGSKPQLQKFADILDIVLGTSQSEFFLILDALDECPVTGNDERRSLLQFLEELLEKHRIRIHILATSRPEPDIRSRLERYQSVDMELGLGQDVETFVRAQVTHGRLREWGESVKRRILEKLLDIPERRFRWADLQIRRLEKSKTEDALHKALDSIPVTLEDTYKDTLERLSEDDRQAARTILIWLSFSAVPMDLKTVAAVVSFRFPEDVVTTCTTSLVTVSISDDTVRLAHFSVKEFLVRNEVEGHWYQFSVMSGHEAIANRTIDCLLENTEILTKTTAGQQPLLIYAAKYWDHHLAELRDLHAKPTGLQEKVDRLFTERDVYFNWTFRLLLSRRDTGAAIDKEVLLAAAGNRLIGSEIMEVLLDECGQDTVIDGEIIQEVVQNRNEGLGMMKTLLRRQQVGFVVTEQILCTAAANHSREMLELLVNNAGDSDIPITGKTLRSVADNFVHGQTLIEYLFELRGDSLPISDDVLVSIADGEHSQSEYVLTFILERWPDFPVTDRLLEAACTLPSTMSLLLDRRCDSLPIEKMIHKITNDRMHGAMVLKMLLDRQLVDVDEGLVETVAGGSHALDVIYRKKPDFPVTPKIVVKAARDCGALRILLDRQKNQALITEEVVKASLSGFHPYESINLLLTRLEPEAVPITEDILIYAIKTKILNQNIRALRLLLEQRRDLNLSTVWEAMWQDTELNPFTLAQAAGVLFQYAYFDVSFEMLEMFPSVFQHEWFTLVYPFDGFIRVCMQHRVPLPTTEAAVELIVERASLNTIDIFLEDHPDIPITEKYIEAAKRNPGEDVHTDELVSLLLSTRSRAS
ncbi:hypothetical protein CBS147352_987 [Aspergillus niger]|nr:hypothetical protein CBS147352_987 [Aspergillus niger]